MHAPNARYRNGVVPAAQTHGGSERRSEQPAGEQRYRRNAQQRCRLALSRCGQHRQSRMGSDQRGHSDGDHRDEVGTNPPLGERIDPKSAATQPHQPHGQHEPPTVGAIADNLQAKLRYGEHSKGGGDAK